MKYTGGVDSSQISCAPDRLQTALRCGFLAPLIENCYGWCTTPHSEAPLQALPCTTVFETATNLPQSVSEEILSGVEGEEGYAGKVYGKGGPEGGVVAQVFCNAAAGKDAKAHSYVPTYEKGGVGSPPLGI